MMKSLLFKCDYMKWNFKIDTVFEDSMKLELKLTLLRMHTEEAYSKIKTMEEGKLK